MKKLALALGFLAALPLVSAAEVTREDIRKLLKAGISEDIIVSFIRANGPVAKLSADDIVELKGAGAGEKVLSALTSTPAPAALPACPEPGRGAPAPRVESAPVRTSPVMYDAPSVYYYPTSYYCRNHLVYDSCNPYYYPRYSYYSHYSYYSNSSCWPYSGGYYYSRPILRIGYCR